MWVASRSVHGASSDGRKQLRLSWWLQVAGAGGDEQRMLAAAAARKKSLDGEAVLEREGCWWAVVGP